MHLAALAVGLALSFVQRVENGVVVNYWGPFCDLYKKAEKLGKLVFGKKSKTEYDLYLNLLKSQNMDVIGCRMMNKTRVGGCHLFIQDLLRSKFTLDHYASTKASVRAIYLSPEEWAQLSEFAAVLDKAVRLCFSSQEDRVAIAGEMALVLANLKADYKFDLNYLVVKTSSLIPWAASTT